MTLALVLILGSLLTWWTYLAPPRPSTKSQHVLALVVATLAGAFTAIPAALVVDIYAVSPWTGRVICGGMIVALAAGVVVLNERQTRRHGS